jgi:DNA-binding CsgD family transcriptional regulator
MLLFAKQLNSTQIGDILKLNPGTIRQIKKRMKDNKFGNLF